MDIRGLPMMRGRGHGRGRGRGAPDWATRQLSPSRPADVLTAAATLDFPVVEAALSSPESRARLVHTRSGHGHSLVHMLLYSCRFEKIGEITHQVEWPNPNRTIFRQDFANGVASAIRPLLARTLRVLPELVSAPTLSGLSPLHVAAEIGSTVLVAELIHAGAANHSSVVAPGAAEDRDSLGARQHRRRQLRRLAEEETTTGGRGQPPSGGEQGPSPVLTTTTAPTPSRPYLSALHVAANSGSRQVTRAILDALPDASQRAASRRRVERLMSLAGHPLAREGSAKPRVDPPPREGRTRTTPPRRHQDGGAAAAEAAADRRQRATCAEGGGWDVAEAPSEEARPTACDLDQRTDLSPDEWYRDYFLHNRPVVIRGVLPLSMRCRSAAAGAARTCTHAPVHNAHAYTRTSCLDVVRTALHDPHAWRSRDGRRGRYARGATELSALMNEKKDCGRTAYPSLTGQQYCGRFTINELYAASGRHIGSATHALPTRRCLLDSLLTHPCCFALPPNDRGAHPHCNDAEKTRPICTRKVYHGALNSSAVGNSVRVPS